MRLQKVQSSALITGASGGIGEALARVLQDRYSHLFLVGRRLDRLEQLRSQIRGCDVTLLTGDLLSSEFLQEITFALEQAHGLDLLVNNAGVGLFGSFERHSDQEIQNLVQINLVAPMLVTKALLPALKKRGGQVINIGSAFGAIGYPGFCVYSASKFGLRGWTEALSRELADTSVKARLFSPRATLTEMNDDKVRKLNADLNISQDTVEFVAQEFLKFLNGEKNIYQVGRAERFYAWLNSLVPTVVGQNLVKKLSQIRHHF